MRLTIGLWLMLAPLGAALTFIIRMLWLAAPEAHGPMLIGFGAIVCFGLGLYLVVTGGNK